MLINRNSYNEMYKSLLSALKSMAGDDIYTQDEDRLCDGGVQGQYFEVRLRAQLNENNNLFTVYSLLPFQVPLENTAQFAKLLAKYNYDNFYLGAYDFNPETGKIVFRNSMQIPEDGLSENQLKELLRSTFEDVNKTNKDIYNMIAAAGEQTAVVSAEATQTIVNDLDSLVGWDEFKTLCHEIAKVAPLMTASGTVESFRFQNFLFSVNDGYGLTTALNRLSELLDTTGLFPRSGVTPVVEFKMSDKDDRAFKTPTEIIEFLDESSTCNTLVCIDISEYLEHSKHITLKNFLQKLISREDSFTFAFRVPFLEPGALKDIREVLSDVLLIRSVAVQPFNSEQLRACAACALSRLNYSPAEDIWELFDARIREEKSDGRFYGIRTVEKVVHEMLWLKNKSDAEALPLAACSKTDDNAGSPSACVTLLPDKYEVSRNITRNDILDISTSFNKAPQDGFTALSQLIGMEDISARIREIVTQVKTAMTHENMDRPCLHMRFVGAPGTGKTTVARILGQIFRESGILRNGYFFEYTARDLVGAYIGQTAPKTAAICRDAYGSVLFIDEAYALYCGDTEGKDYGREALTTLISEMENHRDDMVVIMAGYTDDMNTLMEGNAGLRSRMPFIIEFKSYTKEQLFEIFMLFVRKNFRYTEAFESAVHEYFTSLSDEYIASKEFANARFARNLYERTWSKAALRSSLSGGDIELTVEDFATASSEDEFSEKLKTRHKLGF